MHNEQLKAWRAWAQDILDRSDREEYLDTGEALDLIHAAIKLVDSLAQG